MKFVFIFFLPGILSGSRGLQDFGKSATTPSNQNNNVAALVDARTWFPMGYIKHALFRPLNKRTPHLFGFFKLTFASKQCMPNRTKTAPEPFRVVIYVNNIMVGSNIYQNQNLVND